MGVSIETKADGTAELRGPLTIYSVEELRTQLLVLLERDQPIRIDLGEVDACDAAGVQLLVATRTSAAGRGKQFLIQRTSTAIVRCCAAIGVPNPLLQ